MAGRVAETDLRLCLSGACAKAVRAGGRVRRSAERLAGHRGFAYLSSHLEAAGWRRGYAADCKSVKTGSIPVPASIFWLRLQLITFASLPSVSLFRLLFRGSRFGRGLFPGRHRLPCPHSGAPYACGFAVLRWPCGQLAMVGSSVTPGSAGSPAAGGAGRDLKVFALIFRRTAVICPWRRGDKQRDCRRASQDRRSAVLAVSIVRDPSARSAAPAQCYLQ